MTPSERVAAIRERLDAATEGEWRIEKERESGEFGSQGPEYVVGVSAYGPMHERYGCMPIFRFDDDYGNDQGADATFIAHAHADIPWLLSELATAQATIERLQGALEAIIAHDEPTHEPGLEHWDWGNFDDSYEYGRSSMARALADAARAALQAEATGEGAKHGSAQIHN